MTYNVFGGTLNLAQSINSSGCTGTAIFSLLNAVIIIILSYIPLRVRSFAEDSPVLQSTATPSDLCFQSDLYVYLLAYLLSYMKFVFPFHAA